MRHWVLISLLVYIIANGTLRRCPCFFLSSYLAPPAPISLRRQAAPAATRESKGKCFDSWLDRSQTRRQKTIFFQFIPSTSHVSASYSVHVVLDQLRDVLYRRSRKSRKLRCTKGAKSPAYNFRTNGIYIGRLFRTCPFKVMLFCGRKLKCGSFVNKFCQINVYLFLCFI